MKNPIVQFFFSAMLLLASFGLQAQTVYGTYDRNTGAVRFTGNEAQVKANFLQALNDPAATITEVFIYKFPDAEKFVLTGRVAGSRQANLIGTELVPDGSGGLLNGGPDFPLLYCKNNENCNNCAWDKLPGGAIACVCLPLCDNCCRIEITSNKTVKW